MRSLNKVELIGNLTKDPEVKATPQGKVVARFTIATNRSWTTDSGEKREDVEFHRIVAFDKLAEICEKILHKGTLVYMEGRIQTRAFVEQEGGSEEKRYITEIVCNDMITLSKREDTPEIDYRDWETDRKSTRLNSSHSAKSRMPSSA